MGIKLKVKIEDVSSRDDLKKMYDEIKLKLVPLQTYNIYFVDEKAPRSIPLNKYYWGVVVRDISKETGEEPVQTHEALKMDFNPKQMNIKGKIITYGGSTSIMSDQEFIDYWERIRVWALDFLRLYIPTPNEVPWEDIIMGSLDAQ